MQTFIYDLFSAYVFPGMLLAFGLCFLLVAIPRREGLRNYVLARRVMGFSYLLLGVALFAEVAARQRPADVLPQKILILAVGCTQLFLFTCSLITLLDTGFLTRRKVGREALAVGLASVMVIGVVASCPENVVRVCFWAFTAWYVMLLARYVVIFRRYYGRYLKHMENYFSDDETNRLHWVPMAFYMIISVYFVAMFFSWYITPATHFIFMLMVDVFYAMFAIFFLNYVDIFPKLEAPMAEIAVEEPEQEQEAAEPAAGRMVNAEEQALMVRIDRLVASKSLYAMPDLTVEKLASMVGERHRLVSMAINRCRGMNFSTYVNCYRVDEAQRLLEEGWLDGHTLDALALKVGFGSRVNLYRSFKRLKGVSPSDFKGK